jgi:hypothetical protein
MAKSNFELYGRSGVREGVLVRWVPGGQGRGHTRYVDKKLGGVNAVQILSRLNRTHRPRRYRPLSTLDRGTSTQISRRATNPTSAPAANPPPPIRTAPSSFVPRHSS